ncbi:MAG: OB-fold domain-containing protein [Chloroflexi bacterium]|nr:OB-fold domain-containing protein [Chloroflexota bacterium]
MAGITGFGAYIPKFRLSRELIAREWGRAGGAGEKAVANYDEDSVTMGLAAAVDCLAGGDRQVVDGLIFATSTPPYIEKQGAAIIAAAADLRDDILTVDCGNTLRAGTTALKLALNAVASGSAKQVLVAAADTRLGIPRSEYEQSLGDGGAALLVGDSNVIADVIASYSLTNQMVDMWREEGNPYVRTWEDRFIIDEGYQRIMTEAVKTLLKKANLTAKDVSKAVLYAADGRKQQGVIRALGFDPKSQVQDGLFNSVGCTGAAHALLMLAAALEDARPGDKILVASYGDGSDVFLLEATDNIPKPASRRGVKGFLRSKAMLNEYSAYAINRGIVAVEPAARRPDTAIPSASANWREQGQNIRYHGARCKSCGTVQYPPQKLCTRCHAQDSFEPVRLSDKRATLFTYSMDYLTATPDVPLVLSIINFEGGGRALCTLTDREPDKIKVGMPLEMTFRRLHTVAGIHNYYWRAMPVRE